MWFWESGGKIKQYPLVDISPFLIIFFSLHIDVKQNYLIVKKSLLGLTQICRVCFFANRYAD